MSVIWLFISQLVLCSTKDVIHMLQNFGTLEIVIIALLIVLFFGGKKIPEFIRGIAQAIREFKKSSKNDN